MYSTIIWVKQKAFFQMTTIEALKLDTEVLDIEQFMSLTEKEKTNIGSIKIVPPQLMNFDLDDDFGKVKVKYKVPIYKAI